MQNAYHFMISASEKVFCPQCNLATDALRVMKQEVLPVLGEPISYQAHLYKCSVCNAQFATEELEQGNLKTAYDIYRRNHNLLSPERIKAIREKYGLSQRNFSKFLGWGEITIHRYETGAIQDVAHNETLVLIEENPQNALIILNLNKDNLSEDIIQKVEKKIRSCIEREEKSFIDVFNMTATEEKEPTINTGFIRFNLEKFDNLILYFLDRLDGVFKTKLNKLLWYCDFCHFKKHTVSITGAEYIHLPYGPVPNNYELFLWKLASQERIMSEEIIFNGNISGEFLRSQTNPTLSIFNEIELKTAAYVVDTLGSLTAKQISDKSHDEFGYKETNTSDTIPYQFAMKLSIP